VAPAQLELPGGLAPQNTPSIHRMVPQACGLSAWSGVLAEGSGYGAGREHCHALRAGLAEMGR